MVFPASLLTGKFGVGVMGGFKVSLDVDDYDNDWGYSAGGGFLYGINDTVAIDFNILYSENRLTDRKLDKSSAKTVDLALGMQYRLFPTKRLVPYIGAGVSALIPKIRITN